MREPRNRVVQVRRFGGPDGLEVVDGSPADDRLGPVRAVAVSARTRKPKAARDFWRY
jgi:hypothetical protein